jgi:uncharacterized protein (DUF1697 family)
MPPRTANRYVAFLRGINVGGSKLIKMDALKAAFEKMGFKKVKTLLASGNVLFESGESDPGAVRLKIEKGLEKLLGLKSRITLRTIEDLEALEKSDPFKRVKVTPETRLWVTFLTEKSRGKREVFTIFEVSTVRAGMNAMDNLDRTYGKSITTRSWNTVLRILKAAGA